MVNLNPTPTAHGSQSAIMVGADGGADEIYCHKLGRMRMRFHWQQDAATCWVQVAQRSAGGGMGSQFLPRIGQEVLVQFLENDIDRPVIVGALYNGQGEGGQAPTPSGKSERDGDTAVFQSAHDHGVSGKGNLAGGNSPLCHGAAADSAGHRNSAAQWGIIAIAAKAGLGVLAGQNLQLANGETITLMSGQDTQFAIGGQLRIHSGQAIGMLGGAVKAGEA